MLAGVISTITDRGFGFISPDSGAKDIFFHSNSLRDVLFDELRCGDSVSFDVEAAEKGFKAVSIERGGAPVEITDTHALEADPPVIIVSAFQECTAELVQQLQRNPDTLRELHPGTFENLVAEIFRHEGFVTERISGWNEADGGVDLIAVRHLSPGVDVRLAVQCKRWAQSRRLSAEPIRSLSGVLDRFHAHGGVVATTGFFSEGAKKEIASYLWRISLQDYSSILASLDRLSLIQFPSIQQ